MSQYYNLGGNQEYPSSEKIYGRKKFKWGCFGILGAIPLIIIIILAAIFFIYPALTPNKIRGDFMNMAYVKGSSGKDVLWLMTDGSFHYVNESKTPGSYSISSECLFCKTWTYMINPETKEVINKFKTEYNDIITQSFMTAVGNKVWIIISAYGDNEARVLTYNGETGALLSDTKDFINKYPELSSGITNARMEKNPERILADTRDGQTGVIVNLEDEKLYKSQSDYNIRTKNNENNKQIITRFAIGAENGSGKRMKLYKVIGPMEKIGKENNKNISYLDNNESMKFFLDSKSEPLTPDKTYIEGMIYDEDEEGCLILHQDNAGKKANRMITLVTMKGEIKWTIPQSELFDELKVDEEKDPFSAIFFMNDKIEIKRHGKMVMIMLKGAGVMGFDYETGKKILEMEI
jgi:hypothetical protein